jgi:hypothetical protein
LARLREEELKFLGIEKEPANKVIYQIAQQKREKLKIDQQDRENKF